jgi:opine dehydrogenase
VLNIAVLGGGNGAHAAASDLTMKGFQVSLYSRWPEEFRSLRGKGGIGLIDSTGTQLVPIHRVCDRIEEALEKAEVIIIAVPAGAHEYYAEACAGHLREEQILVLNPGSTGGALAFRSILTKMRPSLNIPVCETNTLTYICRLTGPSEVRITSRAKVQFAALPGRRTRECFPVFEKLYPASKERKNVLETSLNNINAVLHPPGMVLNAGWIEHTKGNFSYYIEGSTPAVARVMEELDNERIALCRKLGLETERFADFFYKAGSTTEAAYRSGSLHRVLQESEPNRFIQAPEHLSYRFLTEDIPFGIVPMAHLGGLLGVAMPTVHALIALASVINGTDYLRTGQTLEKMGIQGMTPRQVVNFVENG